jgi:hypothetical protein
LVTLGFLGGLLCAWACGGDVSSPDATPPTPDSEASDATNPGRPGTVLDDGGVDDAGGIDEAEAEAGPVGTGSGRHSSNGCPTVPPGNPGTVPGCSLVGTWTFSSSHGSVSSTGVVEIDADGSYYGGPAGTDLTQTFTFDGAYTVGVGAYGVGNDAGLPFHLLYSCGDGTCVGDGMFQVQFLNGCSVAQLTEVVTACTGNRTSIAGEVILTRQ